MRTWTQRFALTGMLSLVALGCDDPRTEDAGSGSDGGTTDAGSADAGGGADAGPSLDPCDGAGPPALGAQSVGAFAAPLLVTNAPGDDALYVVEQSGQVRRVASDGSVTLFLDIGVLPGAERGLLGLAFHPDYATNGRYFVYFTAPGLGDNTVAELHRDMGGAIVQTLLSVPDPEEYNNGGALAFGPDGYLYAGLGDGGGNNDQHGAIGNALDTNAVYGKIHRLDVDNAPGFEVASNPFAAGGGLATVWAYGLRNPWRMSFDSATGDLWIADVGQGSWEEIDYQPASSAGGENYGWRAYQGLEVHSAADVGLVADHAEPVHVYDHGGGRCAVVGGHVYRGSAIPALTGYYLFGDYCTGEIFALRECGAGAEVTPVLGPLETGITGVASFGTDAAGELYIAGGGQVVRVISN